MKLLSAPVRHLFMMGMVWKLAPRDGIKILEIGSWEGASTLTWAEALQLYNDNHGLITCIDAWEHYETAPGDTGSAYEEFKKNTQHLKNVAHLRGKSRIILPAMTKNFYDIVFIDGDHAYESVKDDIKNARKLVVDNGILCGDDLNLQYNELIYKINCDAHSEKDIITDAGRKYHPGVTLAVYKEFGSEVSSWGGFWALQKKGREWQPIDLGGMPIKFPSHFNREQVAEAADHLRDIQYEGW